MGKGKATAAASQGEAAATQTPEQAAAAGKALQALTESTGDQDANTSQPSESSDSAELEIAKDRITELEGLIEEKNGQLKTADSKLQEAAEALDSEKSARVAAEEEVTRLKALIPAESGEETEVKDEEASAPLVFELNGRKYGFTAKAPKKLDVNGTVRTQEEIINDSEAMTSLILGENAFVKQVF